jgi:hypothetical protein
MSDPIREDELVHVTFTSVKVLHRGDFGLQVELPGVDDAAEIRLVDDAGTPLACVTVERAAPVEWPPRYGDLWSDRDGVLWTVNVTAGGEYHSYRAQRDLRCLNTDKYHHLLPSHGVSEATALAMFGPFTLLHRAFPDSSDSGNGE